MKFYIATEEDNYADEFDTQCFKLYKSELSAEELKKQIIDQFLNCHVSAEKLESEDFYIEAYFGSNEYLIYESLDDVTNSINVIEISESTYNELIGIFGKYSYGVGVIL